MSHHNKKLGGWGEDLASTHLEDKGFEILERNYRNEYGEIDIVASMGDTIVFVEVKTRSGDGYGYPEEGVTATKQEHMIAAATAYLQEHPEREGDWRIDVVAIRKRPGGGEVEIKHFENAVRD